MMEDGKQFTKLKEARIVVRVIRTDGSIEEYGSVASSSLIKNAYYRLRTKIRIYKYMYRRHKLCQYILRGRA